MVSASEFGVGFVRVCISGSMAKGRERTRQTRFRRSSPLRTTSRCRKRSRESCSGVQWLTAAISSVANTAR